MTERIAGEEIPPAPEPEPLPVSARPTVDEMGEWSFPASDPPATWNWDVDRPDRD